MKIQFDKGMAKVVLTDSNVNLNPKVLFAQENGKVILELMPDKVGILRNLLRAFHVTPRKINTPFFSEISPNMGFFFLDGLLHLGYRQSGSLPTHDPNSARVKITKEQAQRLLEAIEL